MGNKTPHICNLVLQNISTAWCIDLERSCNLEIHSVIHMTCSAFFDGVYFQHYSNVIFIIFTNFMAMSFPVAEAKKDKSRPYKDKD